METQLDPSKLFAVATYGCPSMIGANQGLQGLTNKWREENDFAPVTRHHCFLHQESFVGKSLDMYDVTRVAMKRKYNNSYIECGFILT